MRKSFDCLTTLSTNVKYYFQINDFKLNQTVYPIHLHFQEKLNVHIHFTPLNLYPLFFLNPI